jgi:hypothetical protein
MDDFDRLDYIMTTILNLDFPDYQDYPDCQIVPIKVIL